MRLHTNLDETDLYNAARDAGVTLERLTRHGSRTADHAFEVALGGSSKHGGQYGNADFKTATWDEWGIFLAALYVDDPDMRAGTAYRNAEHFRWATGNRYDSLIREEQHLRHKWTYQGKSLTGAFAAQECTKCGAYRRYELSKNAWNEVISV